MRGLTLRPRRGPDGRRQRGQSLVEFALVFPIFALLVFGVLDGGRAILTYNQAAQASRNVARVASVNCFTTATRCSTASGTPIGDEMASQVGAMGPTTWDLDCVDPITNTTVTNCVAGQIVRVRADVTVTLMTPLIAQAMGGTIDVTATSEATISQ
jgi:Flp pilus assembly protein TadG